MSYNVSIICITGIVPVYANPIEILPLSVSDAAHGITMWRFLAAGFSPTDPQTWLVAFIWLLSFASCSDWISLTLNSVLVTAQAPFFA